MLICLVERETVGFGYDRCSCTFETVGVSLLNHLHLWLTGMLMGRHSFP